ncbi:MAG TPA: SDR family NAD(P)-dependent oxidoreductase [Steroidobacteraceae bacterium]|nr:SDR family NAD(P)-dependent oxidoreductase [Steroidobacteraceae bacterium]
MRGWRAAALAIPADVTDAASVERLAAATHERCGDVRLLVNNAGIEVVGFSWDVAPQVWERALRVNVLGVVHGIRAFLPRMLARAIPAYVANLASLA